MDCDKCQVKELLREALEFERARNKELQDKLIAMSSPDAYYALQSRNEAPATNDYYGVGRDQFVEFDEFGQRRIVEKKENQDDVI